MWVGFILKVSRQYYVINIQAFLYNERRIPVDYRLFANLENGRQAWPPYYFLCKCYIIRIISKDYLNLTASTLLLKLMNSVTNFIIVIDCLNRLTIRLT